jgi:hypothetical protein
LSGHQAVTADWEIRKYVAGLELNSIALIRDFVVNKPELKWDYAHPVISASFLLSRQWILLRKAIRMRMSREFCYFCVATDLSSRAVESVQKTFDSHFDSSLFKSPTPTPS